MRRPLVFLALAGATLAPRMAFAACTPVLRAPAAGEVRDAPPSFTWSGDCRTWQLQLAPTARFDAADLVASPWQYAPTWTPDAATWEGIVAAGTRASWWRVIGRAKDGSTGASAPRAIFPAEQAPAVRLLVPAAFGDGADWDRLVAAAGPVGRVVAGMGSGPGVVSAAAISEARAAGLTVLGYVATDGGGRDTAAVEADIAAWTTTYGADGVWLGGVPGGGDCSTRDWYQARVDRARRGDPGRPVVLDARGAPCVDLVSTAEIVAWAGAATSFGGPLAAGTGAWTSPRRAALAWGGRSAMFEGLLDAAEASGIGWLAVAANGEATAWDALPAWFLDWAASARARWDAPVVEAPGVTRLGPPAGCVGIYGLAAHPDGDRLFVSNLHVPFVTVADATTGEWIDAIDLTTAGADASVLPRVFVDGRVLWVSDFEDGVFWRFDVDTYAPLEPVWTADVVTAVRATPDGVWVALADATATLYVDGVEALTVPLPFAADAIDATGPDAATPLLAIVGATTREVATVALDGRVAWWASPGDGQLGDVVWYDGGVFVSDRETGEVIRYDRGHESARAYTGSDTFSLTPDGDQLLVVNRQGAVFPDSGSYEGAPSLVTAMTPTLTPLWSIEVGKTAHFLTYDGDEWWIANEDSLDLSALDTAAGVETLRSPKLGLSLDHVVEDDDGRLWMGSHLTDAMWVLDGTTATEVPTCGWPFLAVLDGGDAYVPCQESGEVDVIDVATLTSTERIALADTFHSPCADGLCTSHVEFVDATLTSAGVVVTDPHLPGWWTLDGVATAWDSSAHPAGSPLHLGVVELDPAGDAALLTYDPRAAAVRRFSGGAETEPLAVAELPSAFPLVPEGDGAWIAATRVDATLTPTATLPEASRVVAAGDGWVLATEADTDLVVYDAATLAEVGRLALADLRVPPLGHRGGAPGAMRYAVARDGSLLVVNSFRGTVERRTLPDLAAVGTDEVVATGQWAALPGVR